MELIAGYMNSIVIPDVSCMLPGFVYRFDYARFDYEDPKSYIAECMEHSNVDRQDRIKVFIFWRSGGHSLNCMSLYSKGIRNIRMHWFECKHMWSYDEKEDKCFCDVCGIWEDEL